MKQGFDMDLWFWYCYTIHI